MPANPFVRNHMDGFDAHPRFENRVIVQGVPEQGVAKPVFMLACQRIVTTAPRFGHFVPREGPCVDGGAAADKAVVIAPQRTPLVYDVALSDIQVSFSQIAKNFPV